MCWSARIARAAAIVVIAAGASGCIDLVGADFGRYVERDEKRFSIEGRPQVSVKTFAGSIEIRPWDKREVQVVIEKRGHDKADTDAIEVKAEQNGNRIDLAVTYPAMRGFGVHLRSRSAKVIVSMPADGDLSARSGDGAIDLDGITGRLQLESGDGSIRARQVAGELDVHTGDGSVTVSGKLTAVRAHSGDGSINIHADDGSSAASDWDITTGDGAVTLAIPEGFGAELDARSGDGSVHVEDITVANVTGRIGRNALRGRLGPGGHNLRLHTGDGSITLKRS
jgi:DUF4097 and DUF4098 domain-containing protein YvlB